MCTCTLILSEAERAILEQMVEQSLIEVHAERRRTEAPIYQEMVADEEFLLRRLLEKLQSLQPVVS
jgi:hypothetical protein